ncbi:hypothetical protein [Candidatus Phytoplasma tritici]|uniref:hypothetical protein n=1 Tax=Candidatus Phytoplasma tritici TaxID=321961 RepID=UPI000409898B|nr:hypothetical protein [Candidatus Phytoplasma tritici]
MKLDIKKNYFFNKKYFKFTFLFVLFVLLFNKFNQNHIFAMQNRDIASSSTSNRIHPNKSKKLTLSNSSRSYETLERLSNKKSNSENLSFYNILKNLKLDLNKPSHLGIFHLQEIKDKFSDILIDFYPSFKFYGSFPTQEDYQSFCKIYEQKSHPQSFYISLKDFEEIFEEEEGVIYNKLKLKQNEIKKRIIYSFFYDTESDNYIGSNKNERWNADNVLDFIVDIEITKSNISDAIPINLLFKIFSYTSDNLFFDIGFGIENISFIKK